MANNITWVDRTNATELRNTTDENAASIYNTLKAHANSPTQTGTTFDDSGTIQVDGTVEYSTIRTVTGSTHTLTAATSGNEQANYKKVRYTFDVDCTLTLTDFDDTGSTVGTVNPIPAGTYDLWFFVTPFGVALLIQNNTGTTPGTLTTPSLVVTAINGGLHYEITSEDSNATAGVLEYSTDNISFTPWASYVFGVNSGNITGLTNNTLYYVRFRNSASGYNPSNYATDSGTPSIVAVDYTALNGLKAILDDAGLVIGEDNSYGNITAGGVVTNWKTITGGAGSPVSEIFTVNGTGITFDSNGVQFDGNGNLEDTISKTFWSFLSGTAKEIAFTGVFKIGVVSNPGANYGIFGNNKGSTSYRGASYFYRDTPDNDGLRSFLSEEGDFARIDDITNEIITPNTLLVLQIRVNTALATGTQLVRINGSQVASMDRDYAWDNSGVAETLYMNLGAVGDDVVKLIGTCRTAIWQSAINDTELATLESQLMAKYSIS